MLILVIGDIIGRPGRQAVREFLPDLREHYRLDMVIANAENAAGGFGLTSSIASELMDDGVNVITSGNHIWAQKEIIPHLDGELPILRPLNYPPGVPGRGYLIRGQTMVVNLIGRTFMGDVDCPFRAMDALLAELESVPPIIIVDFHAEATSEKIAMGWYLDGQVSAVIGTHTHVQTADERILPDHTAYITDVGMTGPIDSIIGTKKDLVIQKFLTQMPVRFEVAKGDVMLSAVVIDVDSATGRAVSIERLQRIVKR